MILTFAEDFSTTDTLDSELMGTPESCLYWNRGVHPFVTIKNLLSLLPNISFTFNAWSNSASYGVFETSRKKSDIVTYDSKIYLSIVASDGDAPKKPNENSDYWLETNINSIRIRSFLWSVEDNFISALKLNRQLLENQYIYNVGETDVVLANDYSGWVFEPKGSDYVKIRINQMSLQANTTDEVVVSVVNQETLITTLTLTPNNGLLSFEDVGYTISGKGAFKFVFPSQSVKSESAYNDSLRYNGFVCYPINGTGDSAASAEYSKTTTGNGLSFNVSCYLDSTQYITNNKIDLAKFLQSQFEYDFARMLKYNVNERSNRDERILRQSNDPLLANEILDTSGLTIAKRYMEQKQIAIDSINRTFDKFLHVKKSFRVKKRVL